MDDWGAMFSSSEPWERWAAHQAAKGNTLLGNAMRYGVCPVCGAPCEARTTRTTSDDGGVIYTYGIVCPSGHDRGISFTSVLDANTMDTEKEQP